MTPLSTRNVLMTIISLYSTMFLSTYSYAQTLSQAEYDAVMKDYISKYKGREHLNLSGCDFGHTSFDILGTLEVTAGRGPKDENNWKERIFFRNNYKITSHKIVELSKSGNARAWVKPYGGGKYDNAKFGLLTNHSQIDKRFNLLIKRVETAKLASTTKDKLNSFLHEARRNAKRYRDTFYNKGRGVRFVAQAYKTGKLSNKRAMYSGDLHINTICMPNIIQKTPDFNVFSKEYITDAEHMKSDNSSFDLLLHNLEQAEYSVKWNEAERIKKEKQEQKERDQQRRDALDSLSKAGVDGSGVAIISSAKLEKTKINKTISKGPVISIRPVTQIPDTVSTTVMDATTMKTGAMIKNEQEVIAMPDKSQTGVARPLDPAAVEKMIKNGQLNTANGSIIITPKIKTEAVPKITTDEKTKQSTQNRD